MIPLWLSVFAFCIAGYLTNSRTYSLLALASIANLYIDNFTSADDSYLMVVYSSIDFLTALAVLHLGDIHRFYQSIILGLALIVNFVMEYALVYDKVEYIESGIYIYIISGLIIAQLIGAGRGLNSISTSAYYRSPTNLFNL